jgi:hypothetical protein
MCRLLVYSLIKWLAKPELKSGENTKTKALRVAKRKTGWRKKTSQGFDWKQGHNVEFLL